MVDVPESFSMNTEQLANMQHKENPLAKYMRTPSIYLKLPSGGDWYAEGSIAMPINGELGVMPMSTKDEIAVNTPDALMNGQAVVDMIESCIPSIKNAWSIPSVDIDTVFIGIRIASYGEQMEYTSTCPECENQDNYEIDLRRFLEMSVDISGYKQPFDYKGMQIYLQPSNYYAMNLNNLEMFEQQRMMVVINDIDMNEEEKRQRFNEIFKRMTNYTVQNITSSINHIVTPEGVQVSDRDQINEFVKHSERTFFEALRKRVKQVNEGIPEKTVHTKCDSCGHEYTTPFTFDPANFFVSAS
jgi:hypothetical protein